MGSKILRLMSSTLNQLRLVSNKMPRCPKRGLSSTAAGSRRRMCHVRQAVAKAGAWSGDEAGGPAWVACSGPTLAACIAPT